MKATGKIRSCFFQKTIFCIQYIDSVGNKRSTSKDLGIHNGAMGVGKILIFD